jgi:release factor glutamine methyltransferase
MIPTVSETLLRGARSLAACSESPQLDAELLLGKILGRSRSGLIAHGDERVEGERARAYATLIEQRRNGAPVAYLTGVREFWSLALKVTPAVLVPRPETELVVELALQVLNAQQLLSPGQRPSPAQKSLLDLGTGSGAIALAMAAESPGLRITAVDISPAALEVAIQNSRDLQLSPIDWRLGSWFEPVRGERFDIIVANPPYVAAADPALEKLAAEPAIALSGGASGLDALAAIAADASSHLLEGGRLIMEHGNDQAAAVTALLERHGFMSIRTYLDLSAKPRVTLGTVNPQHQEIP